MPSAAAMARYLLRLRATYSVSVSSPPLFSPQSLTTPPPIPSFTGRTALSPPSTSTMSTVACRVELYDGTYSHLNNSSVFSDGPPAHVAPPFPGCDYQHWLIVMHNPGGDGATKQQMVDCFVQTLSKVVESEEEAKKKIYNVSCKRYFAFGCKVDKLTAYKMEGLPGVLFVLPDSYLDCVNQDYGAEMFVNGEIVERPPGRQRRSSTTTS